SFLITRPPPLSTLFPTRRSSDLREQLSCTALLQQLSHLIGTGLPADLIEEYPRLGIDARQHGQPLLEPTGHVVIDHPFAYLGIEIHQPGMQGFPAHRRCRFP